MSAEAIPQWDLVPPDTGVFLWRWTSTEFQQALGHGLFDGLYVELLDGLVYELEVPSLTALHRRGLRLWRWTRDRYYQAAEWGWFAGQRVELLQGEIYQKVTQNPPHTIGICAAGTILRTLFIEGFYVREQMPLPLAEDD